MTGWRMAWVVGNKDIIRELAKLKENMDSGQFNAVQETAAYALDNYEKFRAFFKKDFLRDEEKNSRQYCKRRVGRFIPQKLLFLYGRVLPLTYLP